MLKTRNNNRFLYIIRQAIPFIDNTDNVYLKLFVLLYIQNFILFSLHQWEILSRSSWKGVISSGELMTLNNLLSSAYKANELSSLITPGKSLIQIIKNKEPNREPWGTPEITVSQSDTSPFTTTLCRRLVDELFHFIIIMSSMEQWLAATSREVVAMYCFTAWLKQGMPMSRCTIR